MFRFLKAIGRLFSGFFAILTGKTNKVTKQIDANPDVMNARYDGIISDHNASIKQYIDAAKASGAQLAFKRASLSSLEAEIEKYIKLKNGIINTAKMEAEKLQSQGLDPEKNIEYLKHKAMFTDTSSTLSEKQKRREELLKAIAEGEENEKKHLFELRRQRAELEKVKTEKGEMVARMISAKMDAELNATIAGLSSSVSGAAEERARIKEMVMEAEAGAKITGQIAGTDTLRIEEEYLQMATTSEANAEFEQLMGRNNQRMVLPATVVENRPLNPSETVNQ
jgi:hypothetical protein